MQKINLVIDVDAEDEEVSSQQPFTISSETVEDITIEDDDEEDVQNKRETEVTKSEKETFAKQKITQKKIAL